MPFDFQVELARVPDEIQALVFAAAFTLQAYAAKNRCVNASWVCVEALRGLGFEAEAVSVHFWAKNKELRAYESRCTGAGDDPPLPPEAWGAEAFADDESWVGHVVILVGDILIDAAASQFHRPDRGLLFPEVLVVPVGPGFLAGKPARFQCDNGFLIGYRKLEDERFRNAPGFSATASNVVLLDLLRSRMRDLLASRPRQG